MRDARTRKSGCTAVLLRGSGALLNGSIAIPEELFADVGDAKSCRLGSRVRGMSIDEILVLLDALESMFDEPYG